MEIFSKEMQEKINKLIGTNSLILYNQHGEAIKFDYQRHVFSSINEIPGSTNSIKIYNSIVLAVMLLNSWEIHIKKSEYPYEWYGCIQVENEWLKGGTSTPPVVIFNSIVPQKIKNYNVFNSVDSFEFPINLEDIEVLRKMKIKKAFFEEDNSIIWRLY